MAEKLEEKLQSQCFIWFHNTFPNERGLLHANNNNSENAIKGNRNKAIGVVPGVADMEYCKNGKTLFIEFKRENGKQSEKQSEFQKIIEREGFRYEIIRTFEEFKELILAFKIINVIFAAWI